MHDGTGPDGVERTNKDWRALSRVSVKDSDVILCSSLFGPFSNGKRIYKQLTVRGEWVKQSASVTDIQVCSHRPKATAVFIRKTVDKRTVDRCSDHRIVQWRACYRPKGWSGGVLLGS